VKTSTGGRLQNLGLGGIQLKPIGTHPLGDVIKTVSDDAFCSSSDAGGQQNT